MTGPTPDAVTAWILGVVYVAGWLMACRVLVRYLPDVAYAGLNPNDPDNAPLLPIALGFVALWWPALAALALFALPVWLVTRGADR